MWVLLRNIKPNGWKDWHIEPEERFSQYPPNQNWALVDKFDTSREAAKYIEGAFWRGEEVWYRDDNGCLCSCKLLDEQPVTNQVKRNVRPRLRFKILKRDGYCCQLCGRTAQEGVKLEVDHIIPIAANGSNHPDNLWTLCHECNAGKGTQLV